MVGASRGRRETPAEVLDRYDTARAALLAAVARLSAEEMRSPDGWSWAYDCLHGHVRKHLAMLGPWCATRRPSRASLMPTARHATPSPDLTIESIVAVDDARASSASIRATGPWLTPPRPPVRASSSRLSLRGGYPAQLTASEKPVIRSAVVARRPAHRVRPGRGDLGRRDGRLAPDQSRRQARRRPRSALVARRPQAGVPVAPARLDPDLADRCAGPAPRPAGDRAEAAATDVLTATGVDVDAFEWAPDGAGSRSWPSAGRTIAETSQIAFVDVATGESAGRGRRAGASTSARAGCPTARSSTCPMPTAGSRSSA